MSCAACIEGGLDSKDLYDIDQVLNLRNLLMQAWALDVSISFKAGSEAVPVLLCLVGMVMDPNAPQSIWFLASELPYPVHPKAGYEAHLIITQQTTGKWKVVLTNQSSYKAAILLSLHSANFNPHFLVVILNLAQEGLT